MIPHGRSMKMTRPKSYFSGYVQINTLTQENPEEMGDAIFGDMSLHQKSDRNTKSYVTRTLPVIKPLK